MNPFQKFLWFAVFLAGLATAAAAYRAFLDPTPPLPVLGEAGPAGSVRLVTVVDDDCGECLKPVLKASPEIGRQALRTRADAESVDALYAIAGPPNPDPGEIVLPKLGNLGEWSLTAEDGKPFGRKDVEGKVWISDFIFTRCASACPAMCQGMERVIASLPDDPRLRFVSLSVDPEYDTPDVLADYRKTWKTDPRWRFVTGMWVYKLAYEGFKVEEARPNPEATPGNEFFHSQRFTLVDGKGEMRGAYVYDYENPGTLPGLVDRIVRDARALLETPEKIADHVHDRRVFLIDQDGNVRGVYGPAEHAKSIRHARRLALEPQDLMSVRALPALNAGLNFSSFLFLSAGLALILNRRITAHKVAMTIALVASLLFLASYLTYHFNVGSVKYLGEGWMRTAYFGVLLSHTVLAAVVAPLALVTVVRAWRGSYDRHVAIARWTLPVWTYVSLTGILVYLMLYRL